MGRETCKNNSRALNSKALHIKRCIDGSNTLSRPSTAPESYPPVITATSGVRAHTATVTLVVTDPSDFLDLRRAHCARR